jgi:hypothetical protein
MAMTSLYDITVLIASWARNSAARFLRGALGVLSRGCKVIAQRGRSCSMEHAMTQRRTDPV